MLDEELQYLGLCLSPCIIRTNKCKIFGCVGHTTRLRKRRSEYSVLVGRWHNKAIL